MASKTQTSSKSQNQPGADAVSEDVLPDPIDDGPEHEEQTQPATEERKEPEPRKAERPEQDSEAADNRADVRARYRARRAEELKTQESQAETKNEEGSTPDSEDSENEDAGAGQSDELSESETPGEQEQKDETPAPASDDHEEGDAKAQQKQTFELKVDGETRKFTIDELIPLAQKGVAGDDRLQTTKDIIKDLLAVSDQLAANQRGKVESQASDSATASSDQSEKQAEKAAEARAKALEKLKGVAERLQVGDAEEGAAALAEALDDAIADVRQEFEKVRPDTEALRTAATDVYAERRAEDEMRDAVSQFTSKYPEIVERPYVKEAVKAAARDQMLKDWESAGATEKDLAPWRNADAEKVGLLHHRMRTLGMHKGRSYNEILSNAAESVTKEFNIGAPKPNGEAQIETKKEEVKKRITIDPQEAKARIEKKRQMEQPKTAGGRGPTQGQQRPRTPREIVAEMRKARERPFQR